MLHFDSGLCYIGQAIDVVRRFTQHRSNHNDINAFSFIPFKNEDLSALEKSLIYRAESLELRITNVIHVTSVVGDTDLDLVVSEKDQHNWLSNPSYFDGALSSDRKIVLPQTQQDRFQKQFAKIEAHPLFSSVLPLLKRYISQCLPAPRRTEYSFWSVSCMPSTNAGTWPRLLCVNAGVMELFVAGWVKHKADRMWTFINVAEDVLLQTWHSLDAMKERYPYLEITRRGYRDAGQHQVSLQVHGADEMMSLLADEIVRKAAGALALRVMRKRATIYAKFHCPQLANSALMD